MAGEAVGSVIACWRAENITRLAVPMHAILVCLGCSTYFTKIYTSMQTCKSIESCSAGSCWAWLSLVGRPTVLTLLAVEGLGLQSSSYHPAFSSRCSTCLLSLPAELLSMLRYGHTNVALRLEASQQQHSELCKQLQ
eukprot:1155726-Pelagomonas_calceolata.AAC.1